MIESRGSKSLFITKRKNLCQAYIQDGGEDHQIGIYPSCVMPNFSWS